MEAKWTFTSLVMNIGKIKCNQSEIEKQAIQLVINQTIYPTDILYGQNVNIKKVHFDKMKQLAYA